MIVFAGPLWTVCWFRMVPGRSTATHAQMRWYDNLTYTHIETASSFPHAGSCRSAWGCGGLLSNNHRTTATLFMYLIIALVGSGKKHFQPATLTKSPRRLRRASGAPRLANFMRVFSHIFSHLEAMLDILKKKLTRPGQSVSSVVTWQCIIFGGRAEKLSRYHVKSCQQDCSTNRALLKGAAEAKYPCNSYITIDLSFPFPISKQHTYIATFCNILL